MKQLFIFLAFFYPLHANGADANYEFSFGTSQMFIDDIERQDLKDEKKVILPTTSALFIGERYWGRHWSSIVSFNLPLVTQKFIVAGELVEEVSASTLSMGQGYRFNPINISNDAFLTLQLGALVSVIKSKTTKVAPSFASRVVVSTHDGFAMYLGSLFTIGLNGYVLFYGVGHSF